LKNALFRIALFFVQLGGFDEPLEVLVRVLELGLLVVLQGFSQVFALHVHLCQDTSSAYWCTESVVHDTVEGLKARTRD